MQGKTRRFIYLFLIISLIFPLTTGYTLKPAPSSSVNMFFNKVDSLEDTGYAFIALDFGPQSKAENLYQAKVVIEHLMRKRIPIILFSMYTLAEPILESLAFEVANNLQKEIDGEYWEYGKDWINLGFRPGASLLLQAIPKSKNLQKLFSKDAKGNDLKDFPRFDALRTINDIIFLGQFTSLTGVFDTYLQFFKTKDYRPVFGHGCSSITIPESHIYLDSGQIDGLIGGIAGASAYEELLNNKYDKRNNKEASVLNTGVGVAQLLIVILIILGNINFTKLKKYLVK